MDSSAAPSTGKTDTTTKVPLIQLNHGGPIPQLGLGTWKSQSAKCQLSVEEALKAGYRHIDTAQFYENHQDIATAIKKSGIPRSELYITSKIKTSNFGYESTKTAVDNILKELNVDYVDLILLHFPAKLDVDPNDTTTLTQDRKDSWKALEEAYAAKKTKSIGVSNYMEWHIEEMLKFCKVKPCMNQFELSPFLTQKKLVKLCQSNDIAVTAYSQFALGMVFDNEVLKEIAAAHKKSVGQVVVRWVLQSNIVCIPKSVTPSRIQENFNVFDFTLSQEEMETIDGLNNNLRTCWDPSEFK